MIATAPYTCQTGHYTIDQLGGDDCAVCGQRFRPGDRPRKHARVAEWTLYAHPACLNGGAR